LGRSWGEYSTGKDMATDEKRRKMPRPMAVSDLLATALHGKPVEKRLQEGKIWLIWDGVVGPAIAAQARPAGFRDGTLTVLVANAPWMQQLNFLKRDIMARLNVRLGCDIVKDIYLRAGRPETPAPPAKTSPPPHRPLSKAEREQVAARSAAVNDPDLRSAIADLLSRHLSAESPTRHKPE
jgi:predicted nucleic acid-binding Zn ribbon protein